MENIYKEPESPLVIQLFNISQLLIYIFSVTVVLSSFLFILNIGISSLNLPIATLFAILFFKFINKSYIDRQFVATCILTLIVFYLMELICGFILDFSWDGNAYHKVAVGLLKNGWNPLYQKPAEILSANLQGNPAIIFIECYPKATWIFGASIYALTGNIECGKVSTLLALFSAFGTTLYFLRAFGYSKKFALLFSLAAATNPIALSQFDTFYLDGCLQLILYILVISLVLSLCNIPVKMKNITNALIGSCVILCFNMKFTGVLFICIYCGMYFVIYCFHEYSTKRRRFLKPVFKKFVYFAVVAFVAFGVVGGSTYITNYLHHGNIGHPIIGKNKIYIMETTAFESQNRLSNLFYSLFSYQENLNWKSSHRKPFLKVPFTYSLEREHKIANNTKTDLRIGGFGPFFSGLLILGSIFIFGRLIFYHKEPTSYIIFFILLSTLLLCALIYESWWARYAPYVYYVVLCGIFAAYLYKHLIFKYISLLMCIVLTLNNCYFVLRLPSLLESGKSVKNEILEMRGNGKIFYNTDKRLAYGTYFNLIDSGISVVRDDTIEQRCKPRVVGKWQSQWCPQQP